jgi:hypothetical protein
MKTQQQRVAEFVARHKLEADVAHRLLEWAEPDLRAGRHV